MRTRGAYGGSSSRSGADAHAPAPAFVRRGAGCAARTSRPGGGSCRGCPVVVVLTRAPPTALPPPTSKSPQPGHHRREGDRVQVEPPGRGLPPCRPRSSFLPAPGRSTPGRSTSAEGVAPGARSAEGLPGKTVRRRRGRDRVLCSPTRRSDRGDVAEWENDGGCLSPSLAARGPGRDASASAPFVIFVVAISPAGQAPDRPGPLPSCSRQHPRATARSSVHRSSSIESHL